MSNEPIRRLVSGLNVSNEGRVLQLNPVSVPNHDDGAVASRVEVDVRLALSDVQLEVTPASDELSFAGELGEGRALSKRVVEERFNVTHAVSPAVSAFWAYEYHDSAAS